MRREMNIMKNGAVGMREDRQRGAIVVSTVVLILNFFCFYFCFHSISCDGSAFFVSAIFGRVASYINKLLTRYRNYRT